MREKIDLRIRNNLSEYFDMLSEKIGPPAGEFRLKFSDELFTHLSYEARKPAAIEYVVRRILSHYGVNGNNITVQTEYRPKDLKNENGTLGSFAPIFTYLPEGPQYYDEDTVTDQPERQICAELVREKLLRCLDKEIPHGTAIEVTKFSERENGLIDMEVTIFCEKESHKGIIIGKKGAMLKKIGELARHDIEDFMGTKVNLQTWVKVKENWRDSMASLRNFGFTEQ